MLKIATENDIDAILEFCEGDLLGTRIGCYCLAYGLQRDFLQVWVDNTSGSVETVIAKFYDSMTIKTKSESADEIRDFISVIGCKSLEISAECCEMLGLDYDDIKATFIFDGISESCGAVDISEEYYKALYKLVSENISDSFNDDRESYLAFLSDFTFRKRRSLARSKGIFIGDKLVSTVITAAETPGYALISAVSSDKSVRGQGIGKKTVLTMVNELISENKTVFVVALNDTARGFYEHIGFRYNGDIAIINK